jgi:hypothetical protein
MKIHDWHIVCRSLGKQLNLEIFLGVIATTVYFLADILKNYSPVLFAIIKGVVIFLAAYYFVYSIILTKKIIEKHFR